MKNLLIYFHAEIVELSAHSALRQHTKGLFFAPSPKGQIRGHWIGKEKYLKLK